MVWVKMTYFLHFFQTIVGVLTRAEKLIKGSPFLKCERQCPNGNDTFQKGTSLTWGAPRRVTSIQSRVLPLLTDPPNLIRKV